MAKSTATLTDNETGKSYEMPILHGTIGPRLVDIRKFYGDAGMFTYDPGFTSTGSCGSKITYIDGDEGILLYRGYNIAELAEQSDFMECSYLLMKGELPNKPGMVASSMIVSASDAIFSPSFPARKEAWR